MTAKTFDIDAEDAQLILDHVSRAEIRPRTHATLIGITKMDQTVALEVLPREVLAIRDGLSEEKAVEDGDYSTAVELFGAFHDTVIELLEE